MKRLEEFVYGLPFYTLWGIASALTIAQIVLASTAYRSDPEGLVWAGWICLWTSAVFGWLPIITFRRKGGVGKGESYIKTTVLVDNGIYAIVRHPQMGVAWMLICAGLMLITRHWASVALGILAMVLVYLDLLKADRRCVDKFGAAYEDYMQRVPRVNVVAGVLRLLRNRMAGA
jgi:protein-S-isoprenylcysteine O-methyltransferase Ste14